MKRTSEVRTITVYRDAERSIDANVRVRGFDARAGGRGFARESYQPLGITVREMDTIHRLELPVAKSSLMLKLAPVAGFLLVRALVKKGRQK